MSPAIRWQLAAMAMLITVSMVLTVADVGKARKPITPGVAAGIAVLNGWMIVTLLFAIGGPR